MTFSHLDHLAERGCDLFRVACERDLEGIVAKWGAGILPHRRPDDVLAEGQESGPHADRHEQFDVRQAAGPRGRAPRRPDLVLV
jgi:hypothetical protein